MKVCTHCGKSYPIEAYHKRSDMPWIFRAECRHCYNANRAKKRAEKRARDVVTKVDPAAQTDNPFLWRTFVQPVKRDLYKPFKDSNRHLGDRV